GNRIARAGARRRAAARELRQHDQARSRARARVRPRASPRRAQRLGRRGRRAAAGALAARQCGIRAARVDGGWLVADFSELGGARRTRLALSAGARTVYRACTAPPDARAPRRGGAGFGATPDAAPPWGR